jgi:hypothetical protein
LWGLRSGYTVNFEHVREFELMKLPGRKPSGSVAQDSRKSHARSRVSNGRDVLPNIDGRSLIARRYRDIVTAIVGDQGGADHCSESRTQLIRRFAAAAVLAEQMESKLANGKEIDIQEHALLCSTLVRVAQRIGIDRRARTIVPDLKDYLEGRATEVATE